MSELNVGIVTGVLSCALSVSVVLALFDKVTWQTPLGMVTVAAVVIVAALQRREP